MSVYSIILCGGPGSRLWPESTPASPKPFIDLIGEPSLFQRTVVTRGGSVVQDLTEPTCDPGRCG